MMTKGARENYQPNVQQIVEIQQGTYILLFPFYIINLQFWVFALIFSILKLTWKI